MNEIYSILQREVNHNTGKRTVSVCKRGLKETLEKPISYCILRSTFNRELSYYLTKTEDEEKAIKELKKKVVKEDILYIEIR